MVFSEWFLRLTWLKWFRPSSNFKVVIYRIICWGHGLWEVFPEINECIRLWWVPAEGSLVHGLLLPFFFFLNTSTFWLMGNLSQILTHGFFLVNFTSSWFLGWSSCAGGNCSSASRFFLEFLSQGDAELWSCRCTLVVQAWLPVLKDYSAIWPPF